MTDTSLILHEIRMLREAMEEMRSAMPKPRKKARPKKEDVLAYAKERGRQDIAERFYDYYEASDWKRIDGKPVLNWKSTFVSWEGRNEAPKQKERTLWE